jgi:hypothetical protein
MRYLYGVFVFSTLVLVWAIVGVVRHIRRHNAEVSAHVEAHETATNPPLD